MSNTTTPNCTFYIADELNPVISQLKFLSNSLCAWDDMRIDFDEDSRYGLCLALDEMVKTIEESVKKQEECS